MEGKYVRMVKKMALDSARAEASAAKGDPYTTYIVQCSDGSLYTGIAKDVEARVKVHNTGKGAAYTRARRPVTLLYQEACRDRSTALMREIQIKRLPRAEKLLLTFGPKPKPKPKPGRGLGLSLGPKVLLMLLFALPALAEDRLLSELPEGWEIDKVEEAGKGSLPRVAWSKDLNTVVYVAISGGRRKVAVNDRFIDVDSVGPLGYTPDGLTPVFVTRLSGSETLHVGGRAFGPFEALERPALSANGAHVAFFARAGDTLVAYQDDKVLARAPFVGSPVLDASGRAAFWTLADNRWTLHWKGKSAPGTPFKAKGATAALPEVGQPVFSRDGKHVAFARRKADGRAAIVRDGKEGPPFLTVGDPVFSPDSASLAYGAASGPEYEINTLVVDGQPPVTRLAPPTRPPLLIRSLWSTRYLRDGRLSWFAALEGGRSVSVIGKEVSAEYDSVTQPAFDADNTRAAFAANTFGKNRVVVDGVPGPPYDSVTFLQFDETGRRFAYTAKAGTATFVVLDGVAGEAFDEVGWIRFSRAGLGIAYWARSGASWYIVVDGRKLDTGFRADLIGNLLLAGPDGAVPVYSVREDSVWTLIAGANKAGPFDEIGGFVTDADPGFVTAGTRVGRRFHRRTVPLTGAR